MVVSDDPEGFVGEAGKGALGWKGDRDVEFADGVDLADDAGGLGEDDLGVAGGPPRTAVGPEEKPMGFRIKTAVASGRASSRKTRMSEPRLGCLEERSLGSPRVPRTASPK